MNDYIILAIGIGIIVGILAFAFIHAKHAKNTNDLIEAEKKKNAKNWFYFLYRIYMATPVIKRYFAKLKKKYRSIFPADEVTLNIKVTKEMSKCLAIGLGLMLGVIIICKGDLPYIIIGCVGAYIVFTAILNGTTAKMELSLLEQLDDFITDTHAYYHDSHNVEDAILSTIDTLPYEIGLHADKILGIITSPESDLEMEKYIQTSPNRYLLLMATICNSIKEYGDKMLENGKSLFLTNLNHLKNELSDERIRLIDKRNAYAGTTVGCLIPLFVLKPAESILLNSMPDLQEFYSGIGGIISLAITTAITLICYEVIEILKDDGEDDDNEHRILKVLAEIGPIKKFLTLKINKNYSKSLRTTDRLKATGDTAGLPVFLLKQYVWAIAFFIVVSLTVLFGDFKSKQYILNNFDSAFGQELVPSEDYRKDLQSISLNIHGEIRDFDENLDERVQQYLEVNGYDTSMKDAIVAELTKRAEEYSKKYYKWYYLLIGLFAALIGYYVPYILLIYKYHIRQINRENEVSMFRTVILILMHEDGMMIDTVLEWLERFAHAFKSSISECIMNLEYSQQEALEELKERESGFAPFRRLASSLIATDDVGLEGAFDDLETEREFYREKRKRDTAEVIKKNSNIARLVMFVPIFTAIIMYVVYPFAKYAMNLLEEFNVAM